MSMFSAAIAAASSLVSSLHWTSMSLNLQSLLPMQFWNVPIVKCILLLCVYIEYSKSEGS